MTDSGRVLEPGRDFKATPLHKLIRARVLLDELHADFEAYRTSLGRESVTRFEPDRKQFTIYARIVEEPPLARWALLLGDVLHNFRSALDGFAWELAKLDGGVPSNPRSVYFPMHTDRQRWTKDRQTTLSSIPPEILDRLAMVQPFVAEPVEKGIGLFLHRLDIDDKHRSELAVDLKAKDKTSYAMHYKFEDRGVSTMVMTDRGFEWLAPDMTVSDNMPILRAESLHRLEDLTVEKLPLVLEIVSPGEPLEAWSTLSMMDLQVHRSFEIVCQGFANDDPNIWWRSVFSDR